MACWHRLPAQETRTADGRRVAFYVYLCGAALDERECTLANAHILMRAHNARILLFAHAASFCARAWDAVIAEFADTVYGGGGNEAVAPLSAFGCAWPPTADGVAHSSGRNGVPARCVALAFDFANHGDSDMCVQSPLPVPVFARSAMPPAPSRAALLEAGAAWYVQRSMLDNDAGRDSEYWRAWRADIGAVVQYALQTAPHAKLVGVGHSLGGAAVVLACEDFPAAFARLVVYEPACSDPEMPLWGFAPAHIYAPDLEAAAAGRSPFPALPSALVDTCVPHALSADERERLATTLSKPHDVIHPFMAAVLRRRDVWESRAHAQAYLARRAMYADMDARVLSALWDVTLRPSTGGGGDNDAVLLRPSAQIEACTYASLLTSLWSRLPSVRARILFIVGPDAHQFGPNTQAQAFALALRAGSAVESPVRHCTSQALLLRAGHHFFPLAQPRTFAAILRAECEHEWASLCASKL